MKEEKIAKFIKKIRKENNLTQKDLANKYNVTYQAVSKWENGKNLPDKMLLKQMSKDFNVSLDDLFDGNFSKKNNNKRNIYIAILLIIIIIGIFYIIIFLNKDKSFEFKTISSNCNDFNITGSVAYNNSKTSIYISNVYYCGKEDNTVYDSIECILYERNGNTETKISEYKYNDITTISDFLDNMSFTIDNYNSICTNYSNESLYLLIKYNKDGYIMSHEIPLKLDSSCEK